MVRRKVLQMKRDSEGKWCVDLINGVRFLNITVRSSCCPTWIGERVSEGLVLLLRYTGTVDAGRAHLCEDLVQPLQRAIEMQLYPAGGAGHSLTSAGHRGIDRNLRLIIDDGFSYCIIVQPNHTCHCQCNFTALTAYLASLVWPRRQLWGLFHSSFCQTCFSPSVWCQIFNTHQSSQSSGNPPSPAKGAWNVLTSHSVSPAFFLHYSKLSCWLTAAGAAPSPVTLLFLTKPASRLN